MFGSIIKLANIFYKLASFPSRKQIIKENPNSKLISFIDFKLKQGLGQKANKYFGISWQFLKDRENVAKDYISQMIYIYSLFESMSSVLERKDINKYSSYSDLVNTINSNVLNNQIKQINKTKNKKKNKLLNEPSLDSITKSIEDGNSTKIYSDETYDVYRINNAKGAQSLGTDTPWCISRSNETYYNQYTSDNLIFYFVVDKTKELTDPYQKIAINVVKNGNKITHIMGTKKTNDTDNLSYKNIPGWDKFGSKIKEDAKQQPEGLLSKVMNGRASLDEINELWNNNKSASFTEKLKLMEFLPTEAESIQDIKIFKNMVDYFKRKNLDDKDVNNVFFLLKQYEEDILNGEKDNLSAAVLELVVYNANKNDDDAEDNNFLRSETIYNKLWKTNYYGVQSAIATKTANPALIAAAATSDFDNVQKNLLENKFLTEPVLNQLLDSEFEYVKEHAALHKNNNINYFSEEQLDEQNFNTLEIHKQISLLLGPDARKYVKALPDGSDFIVNNIFNSLKTSIDFVRLGNLIMSVAWPNALKIFKKLDYNNQNYFIRHIAPTAIFNISNQTDEMKIAFIDGLAEQNYFHQGPDVTRRIILYLNQPLDNVFKYIVDNNYFLTELLKEDIANSSVFDYAKTKYPDMFIEESFNA